MDARARELITLLRLEPHPEGGHYRRVFCSETKVSPADNRVRPALTSIHFLLTAGEHSRWHRVLSDEAWHHHEGAPLRLFMFPPEGGPARVVTLGPAGPDSTPLQVVPAGWWQAARGTGAYTLAGCSVGPGFDFADFAMLADHPHRDRIRAEGLPEFAELG